jgi:hypothetical protein
METRTKPNNHENVNIGLARFDQPYSQKECALSLVFLES